MFVGVAAMASYAVVGCCYPANKKKKRIHATIAIHSGDMTMNSAHIHCKLFWRADMNSREGKQPKEMKTQSKTVV
jgi:hypothetical protein